MVGSDSSIPDKGLLLLAYKCFGTAFADLSISPLYVYKVTFSENLREHRSEDVVFGAFSLVFWTLTLISLFKYAVFLLTADDNGVGGIFAMYSLLCRHAKFSLLPNYQMADEELSTYHKSRFSCKNSPSSKVRRSFDRQKRRKTSLLLLVLLGASTIATLGVFTPAISVLSSIEGLQVHVHSLHKGDLVSIASVVIIGLFVSQHRGTSRLEFLFPPIQILWLLSLASLGVYNVLVWNKNIYRAISPLYIVKFFQATGTDGWMSLSGILLCVAGSEAMFSELGHFSTASIRMAFLCVTYPCLVLQYLGQAAFISKNFPKIGRSFYASIPDILFWPFFLLGTLAAIMASQAVISSSCSVIKQSHSLGCFPCVKVLHTTRWVQGRIYIPEVNWILMVLCLAITTSFRDLNHVAIAYGTASTTVALITSCIVSLVINLVWQKHLVISVLFFLSFGVVETVFLSSAYLKLPKGGWFPLLLMALFTFVMYVWNYGTRKRYYHDLHNKVPMKWILTNGPSLGVLRVPGIGLFYTELASGIPSTFAQFLSNLPALYQVVVFVCVKTVPVPHVPDKERYLVGRVGPKSYRLYRCIVRNGYKDVFRKEEEMENDIIMSIAEFIQLESEGFGAPDGSLDRWMAVVRTSDRFGTRLSKSLSRRHELNLYGSGSSDSAGSSKSPALQKLQTTYVKESFDLLQRRIYHFELMETKFRDNEAREELTHLVEAQHAGITYILGHAKIKAKSSSSSLKKFLINGVFAFLRTNSRSPLVALNIPQVCLIEVGMNYHV
ncbi:hypothetical protein MLD38_023723 [Melastoma candidum]|uniref:Uncharacterized protein n=1 Tax=Melastoma candidum TaxID=119954 RepID=A0ACB9NQ93_9MYRT|nr:hypothetical protein MLD38_023723 [Melastoma candidum]